MSWRAREATPPRRQALEIAEAEAETVGKLIDYMRDLAVGLPDGSHLARRLAVYAHRFEPYRRPRFSQYATNELHNLWRELRQERRLDEDEEDD